MHTFENVDIDSDIKLEWQSHGKTASVEQKPINCVSH